MVMHVGKYPFRLAIGRAMGAALSLNIAQPETNVVKAVMEATGGWGVDVVLEMTGSPRAIDEGFAVLRKGGRVSLFGIPSAAVTIDLSRTVIFKGARLYGINGRILWETWYQMAGLLQSGNLNFGPIITHRIALDDWQKGFDLMTAKDRQAAKVVMFP
jgi:threonine 3-dehydrogenase